MGDETYMGTIGYATMLIVYTNNFYWIRHTNYVDGPNVQINS